MSGQPENSPRRSSGAESETPCFVGRAVAALAADSLVVRKNGGFYTTRPLSAEYGFNDIDGTIPDYAVLDAAIEQPKETFLAQWWTPVVS